jgi:hypothetical protein
MTLTQEKDGSDKGVLINIFNKPLLKPILGRISSDVEVDVASKTASNNTRWIFDVENAFGDIAVQLLDPRSGLPIYPDMMSMSLLPRSASYYEAKPFVALIACGDFTLRHAKDTVCSYRVAVDVLHSATR